MFGSNWFNALLAIFATYGPSCFKTSLQFPCTILFKSCCLTELQHIHFSCSSMFTKTKGSDFNTRFYYVYSLALNLLIFVTSILHLLSAARSTVFLPQNNSLLHKQSIVKHAYEWISSTTLKRKKKHQRHCLYIKYVKDPSIFETQTRNTS